MAIHEAFRERSQERGTADVGASSSRAKEIEPGQVARSERAGEGRRRKWSTGETAREEAHASKWSPDDRFATREKKEWTLGSTQELQSP